MKSLNDILWNKDIETKEDESREENNIMGSPSPPELVDSCGSNWSPFYGFQKACS